MSKIEELDKLDRAIKDAEVRLKSIQASVEQLDKEINLLTPRKNELEQNISFHKKQGSIPIAHEYKKARSELSKTKARLILVTADRGRAWQACKEVEEIIEKFKRDHSDLQKSNENNVLTGSFGGKRGKR